jgi:general secretion pathway protein E
MAKKNIGIILVDSGVITHEQLEIARAQSKDTNQALDQILLSNKLVTPTQLAKAYAEYAGLPYIDVITDKMADLSILAKAPLKFLRDNVVMPITWKDRIVIVTANPINFQSLDELNLLLGGGLDYAVAPRPVIVEAINRYYPLEGAKEMIEELEEESGKDLEAVAFEEVEEKDILAMATEAPVIKLVNHILYQAVKRGASDIHIEPFEKEVRVRYRIDGVMYTVMTPPKRIQGAMSSRLKIMAHLNIAEKRIPQDGRIQIKVADKAIDIRVSILPVAFGERIVMRLLDKTRTFGQLKTLGLSERDYKIIEEMITRPNGIIYVTGPTGSGKTSTLYSVLSELNKPEVNIITVEDPVEYQMSGIGQVQVRDKVGLTFASALRSILRQDPDIIMIGETRDQETAQIAIQAALTGHLVLSTLHTNSAPATITRLIDMGIEPFLIASSVVMAMAQRLVRRLCDDCKMPYKPSSEILQRIGVTQEKAKKITFYKPSSCEECQTGYKGRLAIFEVMAMTEGVAHLTMERADTALIKKQAIKDGMTVLLEDGVRKIIAGLTSIDEVLAVAALDQPLEEV